MNKFKVGDIVKFYDTSESEGIQGIPMVFEEATNYIESIYTGIIKHGDIYCKNQEAIKIILIKNNIIVVEYKDEHNNQVRLAFPSKYLVFIKRPAKWANQKLRTLLETKNFNI